MAVVTIITKNNDIAGVAPSPGNLVEGELAVNTTDRKLYTLDNGGNVILLASGTNYSDPIVIDVNSSSAAVRITQRGSGNALLVQDSANPDATPFVINNTGDVIIGHTASLVDGNFELVGVDNATSRANVLRYSADALGGSIALNKSRSGTIGTQTVVQANDSLGSATWSGSDGTNFIVGASIEGFVDGTPGTNDMPGRLVLSTTADGASSPTERFRITSTGALAVAGAANYGTQGQLLTSAGNTAPSWTDQFVAITFIFSAGGGTIATGIAGDLLIPFSCQITEWTLLADQAGTVTIDIWEDTYANYPPTVADSITGSGKPSISPSGIKAQSAPTGWTSTTINAGDILRFNVDAVTLITRLTLTLKAKRT
jgi:hypothetical protein